MPERVQKGIFLLNEKAPGWLDKIDLSKLDMSDSQKCVLGQVFGHFLSCGRLDLKVLPGEYRGEGDTFNHGFDAYGGYKKAEFEPLTEEWKKQITELRAQQVA